MSDVNLFRRHMLSAAVAGALVSFSAAAHAAVTTETIFSPSNGRNLSFQVYTPPGYATDVSRRYPLVISLHGIGGKSLDRANLYAPTLDARINSGELAPMIWAFPDGQTNSFYGDAFDGHKQVHSNIIGEALPFVEGKYRTIAERGRRAMEGFSMGGFGAAMYTAKHTDLFSAVVEYGGALATWQNLHQFNNAVAVEMYSDVEANWLPYSLWDVTTANAAALKTTVNYKMIVGDADSQYQSNTRFRDHVVSLGIDPHFQVLPGVEHLGGSYVSEGSGLRFLSQHFVAQAAQAGDFDGDGDADAGDFLTWQRLAGSGAAPSADGNLDGKVNEADLPAWEQRFGGSTAAATGVPEPCGVFLLLTALCCWMSRRRGCQFERS